VVLPITVACTAHVASTLKHVAVGMKPSGNSALIDKAIIVLSSKAITNQSSKVSVFTHLLNTLSFSDAYVRAVNPLYGAPGISNYVEAEVNSMVKQTAGAAYTWNSFALPYPDASAYASAAGFPSFCLLAPSETNSITKQNKSLFSRIMGMMYGTAAQDSTTRVLAPFGNHNSISSASATSTSWNLMCPVRLPDVHPLFGGMGCPKNFDCQMTCFLNTVSSLTIVNTNNALSAIATGSNSFSPIQLSIEALATDVAAIPTGLQPCGFTSGSTFTVSGTSGTSAELWMPRVQLSADQEAQMLAQPNRSLRYKDFLYAEQRSIAANTSNAISINIPSIDTPRKIYMLFHKDGVIDEAGATLVEQNATSCAPYYSDNGYGASNLRITVNSNQLYENPSQQDYLEFSKNCIANFSSLDGGQHPELYSGQYSYHAWDRSKLVVIDLSPYVPPSTIVSLVIQGTSVCPFKMRVSCYIEQHIELPFLESGDKTTYGNARYI
jgi:hypothetical protein